jgi:hypothetical protein
MDIYLVQCLCCQADVSATGRSLVQRSPTDCGGVLDRDKMKLQKPSTPTLNKQVEEGRTKKSHHSEIRCTKTDDIFIYVISILNH